ncbi:MAG: hypothetical protein JSW61_11645 [Candidatus Thorarchaeota archaeon]|nr:MAG: hypothetical protein JSW61_11645 [Candidatus Thorarchaeota archaeon]
MNDSGSTTSGAVQKDVRLVRGCPCYKEFGDESVCINHDSVLPIKAISVDPAFYTHVDTVEHMLEHCSSMEGLCYLLIGLDSVEDDTYCVSQGRKLRINQRPIKAADMEAALKFLTITGATANGAQCSSCLYKYIVTLSNVFEDVITDSEKAEMIVTYVKNLAIKILTDFSGAEADLSEEKDGVLRELISIHVGVALKERSEIATYASSLSLDDQMEDAAAVVDYHKQLIRLESIFLFQVETLVDASDEIVALGLLRHMVDIAERVLNLCDAIRERIRRLEESESKPCDFASFLERYSLRRRKAEQRFAGLVGVLNQVDV